MAEISRLIQKIGELEKCIDGLYKEEDFNEIVVKLRFFEGIYTLIILSVVLEFGKFVKLYYGKYFTS